MAKDGHDNNNDVNIDYNNDNNVNDNNVNDNNVNDNNVNDNIVNDNDDNDNVNNDVNIDDVCRLPFPGHSLPADIFDEMKSQKIVDWVSPWSASVQGMTLAHVKSTFELVHIYTSKSNKTFIFMDWTAY